MGTNRRTATMGARLVTLLIAISVWTPGLSAQEPAAGDASGAFDSLSVALRLSANVNRNTFHEFWDPGVGFELEASTPFYLGTVEAGLQLDRFSGKSDAQPDFDAWFPYFGWGLGWSPTPRVVWHNSARIGVSYMRFHDVPSNADERELAVDLSSRITLPVVGRWALDIGARYQVVFTHERLRLLFITAGGRHTLGTPGWLKEFLR